MKAILACDLDGGVGFRGRLPWPKIPGDLARFRRLTTGYPVIMGRGTFESRDMPMPLPERTNIVISTTLLSSDVPKGVVLLDSLDTVLRNYSNGWVIGGANLFSRSLPWLTQVELTLVKSIYNCDAVINLEQFRKQFRLEKNEECNNHAFQTWIRR